MAISESSESGNEPDDDHAADNPDEAGDPKQSGSLIHVMPPDVRRVYARARRLEWATIGFLISIVIVMYFAMGSSQAMRTAWVEDMLSLIPPIAFLIAGRIDKRLPDEEYRYGYHRATTIAFLCASLALFTMGALLLYDSVMTLIRREHPTLGSVEVFGHVIWSGWVMLPAAFYSVIPPVILGYLKHKPAKQLHDKVLYADADMNKADWMTGLAAMAGVIGIGLGFWWADAAAACVISFSVLKDGWSNLREVVRDLMDRQPRTVDRRKPEHLSEHAEEALRELEWVEAARVRLREAGHVYFGEAYLVPRSGSTPPGAEEIARRLDEASTRVYELDWRLLDVTIMVVNDLPSIAHVGRTAHHE